jgi:hypothetical protein
MTFLNSNVSGNMQDVNRWNILKLVLPLRCSFKDCTEDLARWALRACRQPKTTPLIIYVEKLKLRIFE